MAAKQLIIVPHCLLFNGFTPRCINEIAEIFDVLTRCNSTLLQLPCPHLILLEQTGLAKKQSTPLNLLLKRIDERELVNLYSNSLSALVSQVQKFGRQGTPIAGIIGVKGSSTCQVCSEKNDDSGLFMKVLTQKLHENEINIGGINLKINRRKSKQEQYAEM